MKVGEHQDSQGESWTSPASFFFFSRQSVDGVANSLKLAHTKDPIIRLLSGNVMLTLLWCVIHFSGLVLILKIKWDNAEGTRRLVGDGVGAGGRAGWRWKWGGGGLFVSWLRLHQAKFDFFLQGGGGGRGGGEEGGLENWKKWSG